MKKVRRISLDDFDKLSKIESARLIGGTASYGNENIPPYSPPSTYNPPTTPIITSPIEYDYSINFPVYF